MDIKVGDMVKLVSSPCRECHVCSAARERFHEVKEVGRRGSVDISIGGFPSGCKWEVMQQQLEND